MSAPTIRAYSRARDGSRQLTHNFKVREFACSDGSDPIFIAEELVKVLQVIRDHFGKPVTINSGYRTVGKNKAVGGAAYSQHLYGTAADITVAGVKPDEVYAFADEYLSGWGGVGRYKTFTHVDVREKKSRWKG